MGSSSDKEQLNMVLTVKEPANESGIQQRSDAMRRKVLFLTYRFPYPQIGGDRVKCAHLLEHLSTVADVDLVALDEWNTADSNSIPVIQRFVKGLTVVRFSKLRAAFRMLMSLFSSTPIEIAYYHDPIMQRTVDELVATGSYDLVVGFFLRSAPYLTNATVPSMLIAEDSRLLADERATERFRFSLEYLVRKIDAVKLRRYEAKTMKRFSVTTFVATPDEERVKAIDPALRTAILTNGVDLSRFAPTAAPREKALLFAGHLGIYHNRRMAERLLSELYPAIRKADPEIKLWIVGQDPSNSLRALIERTEGATLYANVERIEEYYRRAMIFVHPQDIGAGIQNKLLEAMASGCPVVTTPIGASGIAGIINGMHVMVTETGEEFVNAVLGLARTPEERDWLAKNSRSLIERRYSWEQVYSSMDDIIEGIVPDFITDRSSYSEATT